LHIHPGFNAFGLKFMFLEHLVAKSLKKFVVVIVIIAGDYYLRSYPIVNFE